MDGDDYVLTPLTAEDDDGAPPEPGRNDGDDAVVAAEDYVQSLVTIESNWANAHTRCISAADRRRVLSHCDDRGL
ncbi:Hypothetical protein CINCED_3A006215 [Cinara cedri]|uniref:Uncharacterized protein n=1 Tax=Cinara cedri TaxID=506608 RepID=A0A5E4MSY6_9HEMI|nr:Hypothetical protein CINCED_3A006215 [Cinara cedri]